MAGIEAVARNRRACEVAPGVACLPVAFVNVFMVDGAPGWLLVDAGWPKTGWWIRRAAAQRYGIASRPRAIVLTHGHFDHAGAAHALARDWGVPVYAHLLELPYLTGRCDYPPPDPTVGGALALLSRVFPHSGRDLGEHVHALPDDGSVPGFPDWRWIPTPGHTPGHVALFRERDGVILAGDALATVNQDSFLGMLMQRPDFHRPPAPFTTDWPAACASVGRLAALECEVVAAGHGRPIHVSGSQFRDFATQLRAPRKGRYAVEPARFDENGVVQLPLAVADRLPRLAAGVAIAALIAAGIWKLARRIW